MKHSIVLKFIAILLAACALTVALGSAFGVILLAEAGLYTADYDTWQEQFYRARSQTLGNAMAESYAARNLSDLTEQERAYLGWGNDPEAISAMWGMDPQLWRYQISDGNGKVLESNGPIAFANAKAFTFTTVVGYPVRGYVGSWEDRVTYQEEGGAPKTLYVEYVTSPEYAVTVWMTPESISQFSGMRLEVYETLFRFRYYFIAGAAAGLLLTAVCIVYLCCAAGKKRAGDIPRPGGLNRLPVDIYGAVTALACVGAAAVAIESVEEFIYYAEDAWLVLGTAAVFAAALCVMGFLMALAAQWKMHGSYAWHHSLIGWACGKLWKLVRAIFKMLCKLYELLPLIWRYLLIAAGMALLPIFFGFCCLVSYDFGRFLWMILLLGSIVTDVGLVCYGAYAYGTVLKGARKMAAGELYSKIDTRYLIGAYKTCAENLNALADVAVVAAKNQMKSDRMKTELITNVSHDIKTPLTSIINYIDLLQKAESPEQTGQYLDVLDRQSQRLKKLIEDLTEMSKATTGNMTVEITQVDAVEAINQALGEFADKLTRQDLTVIFRQPETPLPIRADGRLTWRVMSNLLSNVVKYALPGTRVYVDMAKKDSQVMISLKNISKEELNVSADELTERFVRGDAARNTEGSGLGLNIAKSLMELQKGQLQLLVDGDLFKVTLTFPAV